MFTATPKTDLSQEVKYPNEPDGKGSARVRHNRGVFYFGPFGTAHSHVLFGLWKHQMIRSGRASTTKEFREEVDQFLGVQRSTVASFVKKQSYLSSLAISVVCLGIGLAIGTNFFSTPKSVQVDGLVLTAAETEVVRGIRINKLAIATKARLRAERIALWTGKIRDEGTGNDVRHMLEKDY